MESPPFCCWQRRSLGQRRDGEGFRDETRHSSPHKVSFSAAHSVLLSYPILLISIFANIAGECTLRRAYTSGACRLAELQHDWPPCVQSGSRWDELAPIARKSSNTAHFAVPTGG
ncbi:hypothetical protein V2G26_014517 [Clonostachys chloroleuca]